MGIIFNKLNKAIFLKRNGNLEEQIKELKKYLIMKKTNK